MSRILTFSEQNALAKIDDLMKTYCNQCPIKTRLRKLEGKTKAHHFCINECSIGKEIKQLGNELQ
ncbi:TPA: zinc-finger domain-containing protein [Staphylococcus aureus]|nr:zinc-finger domain-containing protein [Staphylococcus aureus]HDG6065506.1 zinc-finger domain-containing protein [Staphylococcus aureus]HDG6066199.1 zinc-finger domain-containing protein [Staphylococcus aureus]HDG6068207.1 zinc-finger domain-containing protein [Staphylococcus aureus]HEA0031648.1 zinc-finger domain-containing protein [Staphylococcus aureus]